MKKYTLFDFLEISIMTDRKDYLKFFDNEYSLMTRHETPETSGPSIRVNICNDTRELSDPENLNGIIKVKKLFTFRYSIADINSNCPTIHFKEHWIDRVYTKAAAVFLQTQLIEPLAYYLLLKKNILFMHAAGVSNKEGAILLPAKGGTGKTSLSLKLVKKGMKLLGDDLLLIDVNNGLVFPYPRPFHLFSYNINSLEGAKIKKSLRVKIFTKNIIRFFLEKITREEFLISTRVHAEELYGPNVFSSKSFYKKIVFLTKEEKVENVRLDSESKINEIAHLICESADLNDSLYKNIFNKSEIIENIKSQEIELTSKLLRQFSEISILNPRLATSQEIDNLTCID